MKSNIGDKSAHKSDYGSDCGNMVRDWVYDCLRLGSDATMESVCDMKIMIIRYEQDHNTLFLLRLMLNLNDENDADIDETTWLLDGYTCEIGSGVHPTEVKSSLGIVTVEPSDVVYCDSRPSFIGRDEYNPWPPHVGPGRPCPFYSSPDCGRTHDHPCPVQR